MNGPPAVDFVNGALNQVAFSGTAVSIAEIRRSVFPTPQMVTCVPTSTTRSVGIWK
jgi:hypothetical protein